MSEHRFKIAEGLEESGRVVGNTFDKYHSKNFLARAMVDRFEKDLQELIARASPKDIHEVGCGEGYWVLKWLSQGYHVSGSDFSELVIDIAKRNAVRAGQDPSLFQVLPVEDIADHGITADMFVCCEVLEHVVDPRKALSALQEAVTNWCVISVPNEPLWRVLNIARGKYLRDLGNTPGHINHWNLSSLASLVSEYFEIIEVRRPTPWSMLLCRRSPRK